MNIFYCLGVKIMITLHVPLALKGLFINHELGERYALASSVEQTYYTEKSMSLMALC